MEESKSTLSFIGIGLGSIALLLAIVHFWAGPFSSQPSLEQTPLCQPSCPVGGFV